MTLRTSVPSAATHASLLVLLFFTLLSGCLLATPAPSPTLADYRAVYEKQLAAIRTNTAAVLEVDKGYQVALDALLAGFKKLGDFEGVTAVMAEQKRFEATRMVPERSPDGMPPALEKAQGKYRTELAQVESNRDRQIGKLTTSYVSALKGLLKALLEQDKMPEAEAVNAEMKCAQATLSGLPADTKMPADIAGRSAAGRVSATGGTVTNYTVNGAAYRAHIFTDSGTFLVTAGGKVDVLVVAGGGGSSEGFGEGAGGGGAGGLVYAIEHAVDGGPIVVKVGEGGAASSGDKFRGANGENSSFGAITASGGGGAGAAGSSATGATAGRGGAGLMNAISGTPAFYAGGGGGGKNQTQGSSPQAAGGHGGGGTGACTQRNGDGVTTLAASAGAPNTGGGAGGGAHMNPGQCGGSGIVIVRYRLD